MDVSLSAVQLQQRLSFMNCFSQHLFFADVCDLGVNNWQTGSL